MSVKVERLLEQLGKIDDRIRHLESECVVQADEIRSLTTRVEFRRREIQELQLAVAHGEAQEREQPFHEGWRRLRARELTAEHLGHRIALDSKGRTIGDLVSLTHNAPNGADPPVKIWLQDRAGARLSTYPLATDSPVWVIR